VKESQSYSGTSWNTIPLTQSVSEPSSNNLRQESSLGSFFATPIIFARLLALGITASYYFIGYWLSTKRKTDKSLDKLQGEWIHRFMLHMGPLYIKIGQILATRSDLLPPAVISQLRSLQDDVPPSDKKHVQEILLNAYGESPDKVFKEFSYQPIASASIAQVHKAVLHTGQKVAVKIVKRNTRQKMWQNLAVVELLLRILHNLHAPIKRLNLPARFAEIKHLLIVQTDMSREAEQQEAIRFNFKEHPYVHVPATIKEFSTPDILVMEFVEGIRGKNSHDVKLPPAQLARRLQDTIYTMLYFDGLSHADPHPGNVFFTEDGKIIFVDFGLTVQLSEDEKWGLSSFYYACTRQEWQIAVSRFTEYFVTQKEYLLKNWNQYQRDMEEVLRLHFDANKNRWSTVSYFHDINTLLKKYNAQYTTNFTKVEFVFISCEGFVSQIDPDIDIWENARKFTDRFSPYMSPKVKQSFDSFFLKKIPRSIEMRDRAKASLVAPTHLDRYFFPSAYPLFVKKAEKGKIEDTDGNIYVDLSCGYGPHILGYAHPCIKTALASAIENGSVNAMGHESEVLLAETLTGAFPSSGKAIFSNSGTEAVIQAIRLCRAYRKRDKVAKFEGHYHGFSDQGMVSSWFRFTGPKYKPEPIRGTLGSHTAIVKNTIILQYGEIAGLDRLREEADDIACVILEPMPTSLAEYDVAFLKSLRVLCDELDIPLIFDEVVSGFRVTYGGVQNLAGVSPDLTCLGKIIGGGLPCGAVVGRRDLVDIAKTSGDPFIDYESKAFVGGTMSGNSLTCTTGLAVLTYLKNHSEIYTQLKDQTDWLAGELRRIAKQYDVPFKTKGNRSIFSMAFTYKSAKLYREKQSGSNFKANLALAYYMRKYGVYMPELHTMMLNAMHTQEDLSTVCQAFDKSLEEMVADGFFIL
jgi:glutamate-1-semialdehyde 2,1-aminomutase